MMNEGSRETRFDDGRCTRRTRLECERGVRSEKPFAFSGVDAANTRSRID
jgi:hypothetical protein